MKNKLKKMMVVLSATAVLSGCTTSLSSPRVAGSFAGRAAYVTYTHVAAKQSEDVRRKVEELWAEINKVEQVSDLKVARVLVGERFDAVIADANLTPEERLILSSIKDEILAKIDEVIDGKLASNQDGVQFLVGVRDGVNAMIELSTPKEQ